MNPTGPDSFICNLLAVVMLYSEKPSSGEQAVCFYKILKMIFHIFILTPKNLR